MEIIGNANNADACNARGRGEFWKNGEVERHRFLPKALYRENDVHLSSERGFSSSMSSMKCLTPLRTCTLSVR
jgi:hypothetical protein